VIGAVRGTVIGAVRGTVIGAVRGARVGLLAGLGSVSLHGTPTTRLPGKHAAASGPGRREGIVRGVILRDETSGRGAGRG
jgi:hypothetical protein